MSKQNKFTIDFLSDVDDEIIILHGFEGAIVGVVESQCGFSALYSYTKCIDILKRDMSEDDAIEYFDYNVLGLRLEYNPPIFLRDDL